MNDETDLLRRYVEGRSQIAFTELVNRHIGLVYGTALRRVGGDTHLAEDVAQKVFTDLARKAPALCSRASLSGWLYISTHVAAATVVRTERRRKARELEAQIMQNTLTPDHSGPDWIYLRPALDDVIVQLKDDDREAIVQRFFEQRTFGQISVKLQITEEAARKRVDRALDKMRALLARQGIDSTSAAIGIALAATGNPSIPMGLTTKLAGSALGGAAAGGGSWTIIAACKAILPTAAVLSVGVWFIVSQNQTQAMLRVELARFGDTSKLRATLLAENRRTIEFLEDIDQLRRASADLPALRHTLADTGPSKPSANTVALTITANNTLQWGTSPVTLEEFLRRLKSIQLESGEAGSKILIHTSNEEFGPLAYIIDEARKAGINHLVVESNATPDSKFGALWF